MDDKDRNTHGVPHQLELRNMEFPGQAISSRSFYTSILEVPSFSDLLRARIAETTSTAVSSC